MTLTPQVLSAANIPRKYWTIAEKDSKRETITEIIENLQTHFIDGDNFLLESFDYALRQATACWLAIRAMQSDNLYFRDKWTVFKPTQANSKGLPYTVRVTDPQTLVDLTLQRDDDELLAEWAYAPDVVILTELGAGRVSSLYTQAVDSMLKRRNNDALMTICTLGAQLDYTQWPDSSRSILDSYRTIKL